MGADGTMDQPLPAQLLAGNVFTVDSDLEARVDPRGKVLDRQDLALFRAVGDAVALDRAPEVVPRHDRRPDARPVHRAARRRARRAAASAASQSRSQEGWQRGVPMRLGIREEGVVGSIGRDTGIPSAGVPTAGS